MDEMCSLVNMILLIYLDNEPYSSTVLFFVQLPKTAVPNPDDLELWLKV